MKKSILILVVFLLSIGACTPAPGQVGTSTPTVFTLTPADWYTVYFTDPSSPSANSYRDGPDEALAAAIEQARLSVDLAIYDLNLWSIRDALKAADQRGVRVRMVVESDNLDEQEIQDLKSAGIDVVGDRHESLMHDKFVVIDRSEVWTGSMNFTTGGGYLDNNNLLRLRSSELAEDYTQEFEQMFVSDRFSNEKVAQTPHPASTIDGSPVGVYFSPQDGTLEHILAEIKAAKESIQFMAYSFTSDELREALIDQAKAGVDVRGVFDEDQYSGNAGTEFDALAGAGIDVRLDGNPHLMHHKVIIIDGKVVITGSYNFSKNAEYNNDENTVIIHNADIAALYLNEFQRVYSEAAR